MRKNNLLLIFILILVVILSFCLVSCTNENSNSQTNEENNKIQENTGELKFSLNSENTYEVSGYTDYLYSVNIPETYKDKKVTKINTSAFENCETLTEITIPKSVKTIEKFAFCECNNLKHINISNGLTTIEQQAVVRCTNLEEIIIPESVTYIEQDAFESCGKVKKIIVDKNNTKYHSKNNCLIETDTNILIKGCQNSIIPDYVTRIGYSAFDHCINLNSIKIPNNLLSIGSLAFCDCNNLTSIKIPKQTVDIELAPFAGCNKLETITIEKGNNKYHVDGNCLIKTETNDLISGLNNSVIPNYIKNINMFAFANFTNLTSISIPEGVISIDDLAFAGCENLQNINIPSSVKTLGVQLFVDCTKLNNINIDENNMNFKSGKNCILSKDGKVLLNGTEKGIIPNCVETIGDFAFNGLRIKEINIPEGVTNIESFAFSYCSKLENVTIPHSVRNIERVAFCDNKFTTITFMGNKEEWNNIQKSDIWHDPGIELIIHCFDGDIIINKEVY